VPRGLSPRLVQAGLLVLAGLALTSLVHRSCFIDDAWHGERAYWLAREGAVRSELFRGHLDYGERMFVFHKLFALSGAAFISLFGWSLYTLKSVSLAFFGVFLGTLWRYCQRFESPTVFPLAALLLLAHGLVELHIFIYRPEVMLMTLGFGSFVLLRSFLEQGRRRELVGSAVLAGLCVLTHLNGLMFIAAGSLLLMLRRRPGPAALFALVASSVGALYLADAALAGEMATLWRQLRTDPGLAEYSGPGARLAAVLWEHQRYFHSRAEISFAVLFLAAVGTTAGPAALRRSLLVPYVLGLAAALALLALGKQPYYAIPLLPYLALIVAHGLVDGLPRVGLKRRVILVALVWLYALNGAAHLGRIIATNEDTARRNRALASRIGHPGATVVASLPFIFNEIENYTVRGLTCYWLKTGFGRHPISPEELFEDARRRGAQYAVIDREDLKFSGWPEGTLRASGSGYRRIYQDDAHVVLELIP
jgi:hypothetical protein